MGDIEKVRAQLCPTGVLRAAINMTNALLVSSKTLNGDPAGVSPDMAALMAAELEVPLTLLPYPGPGYVADALLEGAWDIGNIAAEPERAKTISFSPAYCEIQATYLVFDKSPFITPADVDSAGTKIAAKSRAAYELWLRENLNNATLQTTDSFESSRDLFVNQRLDALAGLRPPLLKEQAAIPGTRVLGQSFTAIQQSIGCNKGLPEASAWIADFVQRSIKNGSVERLIDEHGVTGRLSVSPLCD